MVHSRPTLAVLLSAVIWLTVPCSLRAAPSDSARWERWTRSPTLTAREFPGTLWPIEGPDHALPGTECASIPGPSTKLHFVSLPLRLAIARSGLARPAVWPEEGGVRLRPVAWSEAETGLQLRGAGALQARLEVCVSMREGTSPIGSLQTLYVARRGDRHAFVIGKSSMLWGGGTLGSILMGGSAPDRPQVRWRTARALQLPGPARPLGTWAGEAFFAYLDDTERLVRNPLMMGHRFAWQVTAWAEIVSTRTVMFGGDGRTDRLTPRGAWLILTGKDSVHGRVRPVDSDQKASWEIRVRGLAVRRFGIEGIEGFYEYAGDDLLRFPIPALVARHAGISLVAHGWTTRIEGSTNRDRTTRWYDHQAVFGANAYFYRGYPLGLPAGSQARALWLGVWTPERGLQLRGSTEAQEFGAYAAHPERRLMGTLAARWRPNAIMAIELEYQGTVRRGGSRDPLAPVMLRNQVDLRLTLSTGALGTIGSPGYTFNTVSVSRREGMTAADSGVCAGSR